MPEISIKAIEDLLDNKLDEKLDKKLDPIIALQKQHTTALANIATDVKVLLQAKIVSEYRLEKIEHWAEQVGDKLGIKLEH